MSRIVIIAGSGKNVEIALDNEYQGILTDDQINQLHQSMLNFDPKLNTGLRQTLNRLIAHAAGQASPLSFENVESYLNEINQRLNEGDSGKRVYRANLKKFFTSIDFGDDITNLVSRRKGRRNSRTSQVSRARVPLDHDKRRTKSHKPKHKSQGLIAEQAKRPSTSNVLAFKPLEMTFKNSNHVLVNFDLGEWFKSPYIDEAELKIYAKRIADSTLSEPTKLTYLNALSSLIQYNNEVTKSSKFYSKEVYQSYLKHIIDSVQKGESNVKIESIERTQTFLSNGFGLLKLPKIKKNDKFKIKAGGNDLQTDNYDKTSWTATVRTLIPEHERLYNEVIKETTNYELDFNDFINCSCLLLTVYTAMTFSELANMVCEEYDTEHTALGVKDIVFSAIKYRANKEHPYSNFTTRRSAKTCVERLMSVVERARSKHDISSRRIMFMLHGNVASQISTPDVDRFASKLTNSSSILQDLLTKRPKYKLGLQRLRSSVIQRVSTLRGEASGVIAGRHRLSVHRTYNYSKVSNESAQKDMTRTAYSLEKYARGIEITIAVDAGKKLYDPEVIDQKEKDESGVSELKNGGVCKGKETPESKEFQKTLDKNMLLSDEDKKHMGCGFIIKCFGCSNFAVVDEVNDIWKLLSFESILNSSIESHVSLAHYIEKQSELKKKLLIIKNKFTPAKLKTAVKKLEKRGLHPLWDSLYAVIDKMELS
ncbi:MULTISPECIES: hypothetical protein [Vibrio]|uniref:hypothetical protein n=1 Tax=Vibrio TaxID=662 RepID=UPI002095569D|nr:hypothetical protein [Vibrio paracholerae]MCO7066787.1 hypothetical protein [Vibrio paracholerae]